MTMQLLPVDTMAKSLAGQLQIDRKRDVSLHRQITEQVEGLVRSGHLATDQRLPTHNALGRLLNVHPLTISRAYSELQSRGLIRQHRGRGTFVTGTKKVRAMRVAILLPEWVSTLRQPHEAFGYYQLLGGVENYLRSVGASARVLSLPNEPLTDWGALVDRIVAEHDGAVLTMWQCVPLLCRMADAKFPCVTIGFSSLFEQVDGVYYDLYHAMYLQTEQLIKQGRRRIGYLGIDARNHNVGAEKKFLGYLAALGDYGLAYESRLRIHCSWLPDRPSCLPDWLAGAREMVSQGRFGDALVGEGIGAGPAAMGALGEHGVKVPDDVALVANDEPYDGCHTQPPLTWLYVPRYEMGWEGGRMLRDRVDQPDAAPEQRMLQAKLVLGRSCGDPDGGDGHMPELTDRTHGDEQQGHQAGTAASSANDSLQEKISSV